MGNNLIDEMGFVFIFLVKKFHNGNFMTNKVWMVMQFWPLVGLINYKYMPIHLRVLFHNFQDKFVLCICNCHSEDYILRVH
jgi:hypothetical protein